MTITIGDACPQAIVEQHLALINYTERPGVSTFGVCNLCGFAQFVSETEEKGTDWKIIAGTKFVWADSKDCPKCVDVWRRAPEVFVWTIQCLRTARIAEEDHGL